MHPTSWSYQTSSGCSASFGTVWAILCEHRAVLWSGCSADSSVMSCLLSSPARSGRINWDQLTPALSDRVGVGSGQVGSGRIERSAR